MDIEILSSISYALIVILVGGVTFLVYKLVTQREVVKDKIVEKEEEVLTARRKLHDVRNTLNILVGFCEELEEIAENDGDDEIKKIAKSIKIQSYYTSDITRFRSQPTTFNLIDLLDFLADLFSSRKGKGPKVIFEKGNDGTFLVTGDLVSVFRIFENLIGNARREALKAGGDILVTVDNALKEIRISNRLHSEPPTIEIYKDGVTTKKDPDSGYGLSSAIECSKRIGAELFHEVSGKDITFTVKFPRTSKF